MNICSKTGFSSAAPAGKLFSEVKKVRAARREKILDFFMQNHTKIAIFDGKNLNSGVKSWEGGAGTTKILGGIRLPCPLPPASYAYV